MSDQTLDLTGHELLSSETLENGVFQMVIRRKAA